MNSLQFNRWLVIVNGFVPLLVLGWDAYRGQLGAKSVNYAIHVTGILSLVFLFLSLVITPLRWVTGWSKCKNAMWWSLTQDERRAIFEENSRHNKIGLDYLPAIARRLHHCRDLTTAEPFDFITWFEFAEKDTAAFDQLLTQLHATEEWNFVDREVDIRVVREKSRSN